MPRSTQTQPMLARAATSATQPQPPSQSSAQSSRGGGMNNNGHAVKDTLTFLQDKTLVDEFGCQRRSKL